MKNQKIVLNRAEYGDYTAACGRFRVWRWKSIMDGRPAGPLGRHGWAVLDSVTKQEIEARTLGEIRKAIRTILNGSQ